MNKPFPWEAFANAAAQANSSDFNPETSSHYDPDTTAPVLSLLTSYRLIEVKGADAEKFMQGQFTCDVTKVTPNQPGIGACCNNKGRMLGLFRIAKLADQHFMLRLPASVAVSLVEHLSKFKAFFSCSCAVNPDWACIAYFGDTKVINGIFPDLPQLANQQKISDGALVTKSLPGSQHFEIWLNSKHAEAIGNKLVSACEVVPENLWNLAEIQTGTGEVYPETLAEFIPQMFNLQVLNGISFKKGCYTGQEIVARMQYLGKLKKRLFVIAIEGRQARITDKIYCNNSAIGVIVRVEQQSATRQLALAVLDHHAESLEDALWLDEEQTTTAKLAPLPYLLPEHISQRPKNQ
jgi:folate-binding protein YgfZ